MSTWKKWGILTVLLILALGCAANAENTKKKRISSHWIERQIGWICDPHTIPEDLRGEDDYASIGYPVDLENEAVEKASMKRLSGDPALDQVLFLNSSELGVDNSEITGSGEAVYHVYLESEHYVYEKDVTARIVPFDQMPNAEEIRRRAEEAIRDVRDVRGTGDGPFDGDVTFSEKRVGAFTVPVPAGWENTEKAPDVFMSKADGEGRGYMLTYHLSYPTEYMDNEQSVLTRYAKTENGLKAKQQTDFLFGRKLQADGHTMYLSCIRSAGANASTDGDILLYQLDYARNGQVLTVQLFDLSGNQKRTVNPAALAPIAERISYLKGLTEEDAALRIVPAQNAKTLPAGKEMQFTLDYAHPEAVRDLVGENDIIWAAFANRNGKVNKRISVDKTGKLTVNAMLSAPTLVLVTAVSKSLGTWGQYRITAFPKLKGVSIEPGKATAYVGGEITLSAKLKPQGAADGLVAWSIGKNDQAELTDHGNGTVTVKPLKAGRITVTVKAEGGKSARITVTVNTPVETVEITGRETGKPGAVLKLKAALSPAKAFNKKVEWSVDVEKSIASIDRNGQLRIGRKAPHGTEITVTCKALGAEQPIVATKRITVE